MNFQNDRYTLRFCNDEDNEGIREIFESEGFDGGISVQYLRNPEPVSSFRADGDESKIMVITDNSCQRTIAVGGAVIRQEYINGTSCRCGYLTGLKIHPDYRSKIVFIAKAYQFLYRNISDCHYFYTTILDDNRQAVSLLEKHHKNMPLYSYLGHYTTYCFHGAKNILSVEKNNPDGFDKLMETHFSRLSFTPVNYSCEGFGKADFFCIREKGEITACCFVCNQQEHKQYKMCSYSGIYRFVSHLPTKLLGYPQFPEPQKNINFAVISYLYVKDNDKKLCSDFLRSVAARTDYSLFIWGGFENNPLCAALDKMKTVHYGSRLYRVSWDDNKDEIMGTIGVEAALL
ncbi:MAG: hypothetical protein Q4F95_02615 [Oscillospiraceae bacterium]|nr:hypothetical protein [Oscillospiraceae bacterium]